MLDRKKIFLKEACPTSIGGQAIMEGVMMQGVYRTAAAVRLPDSRIYLKTWNVSQKKAWRKIPLLRGAVSFFTSLVFGMKILMFSADVAVYFDEEEETGNSGADSSNPADSSKPSGHAASAQTKSTAPGAASGSAEEKPAGPIETWLLTHFSEKFVWNLVMALSVAFAMAFAVLVFAVLPTAAVSVLKPVVHSAVGLNLIEGLLRLAMFVLYIVVISRMKDIQRVFEYHGAEHKTIHCFENGRELKPENARDFYTLHPRCGTSFLMFVMVVSLVLFSLLGWPSLAWRIVSRVILMPVVAGISYEILRWAGKSSNPVVEILSWPGLLLQKLTTREPDDSQVEIAMTAMKAVLKPDGEPEVEGICSPDAEILEPMSIESDNERESGAEKRSAQEDRMNS